MWGYSPSRRHGYPHIPLSDSSIRNAKSAGKARRLFDGSGLYLEVTPAGSKLWRQKYRHAGKEKLLSHGIYPSVGLKDARERCAQARALLAQGINPSAQRKAEKRAGVEASANCFEVVAGTWLEGQRQKLAPVTFEKAKRNFASLVFPWLGQRPIGEIEPPEVLACLQRIEKGGHHETAHRVKQRIAQVFRYGIAHGIVKHNPAADVGDALQPVVSKKTRSHHRSDQGCRVTARYRWLRRPVRHGLRAAALPAAIRAPC
jgi:hypothetical protein